MRHKSWISKYLSLLLFHLPTCANKHGNKWKLFQFLAKQSFYQFAIICYHSNICCWSCFLFYLTHDTSKKGIKRTLVQCNGWQFIKNLSVCIWRKLILCFIHFPPLIMLELYLAFILKHFWHKFEVLYFFFFLCLYEWNELWFGAL